MKKSVSIFICFIFIFVSFVTNVKAESVNHKTEQLLIVNKKINKMAFYDKGILIKVFDVATGRKPDYTPEGLLPIVNKIKNRPYYSKNIKGGHPKNPLGDRWLGLSARGTYGTTYAIHGNNNEKSIGTYASAGCIRMHNEDIRWLYDQIKEYTNVYVVSSNKKFEDLAKEVNYPLFNEKIIVENNENLTYVKELLNFKGSKELKLYFQRIVGVENKSNFYLLKTNLGQYWVSKKKLSEQEWYFINNNLNKGKYIYYEFPVININSINHLLHYSEVNIDGWSLTELNEEKIWVFL